MQEQENSTIYMQYFCKARKCDNIFIAEDLYGRSTPETWRYCPNCEKKGKPKIRKDPYEGTNHYEDIINKKKENILNVVKNRKRI
jgi:hypothetical protein